MRYINNNGPRVTDEKFFNELVDTSLPGLEGIAVAAAAGDYAACKKIFADRVRANLNPDLYQIVYEETKGSMPYPGAVGDVVAAAEEVCKNRLGNGPVHDFGDMIDWTVNGTEDGYVEWTWGLNRHRHWITLADAYKKTGNEKYAECFARQFESWVRQAIVPADDPPVYGNMSQCWRTIEAGQRMSGSFPYALHTFYKSPAFTDALLVDFYKSIWEHGDRITKWHARFNWFFMEMDGLGQMSVLYPEIKDSSYWYNYTVQHLREEFKDQVYPDGFQAELSTGYQNACISHPMKALVTADRYGKRMPQDLYDSVEHLLMLFVKLATPVLITPAIGDGHENPISSLVSPFINDFRHNPVLLWAATNGREGHAPEFDSIELPYSGYMVMRTGWKKNDIYAYFDGGPFGLCHQHQDKLNLVVFANGHYLLPETGSFAYDTSLMRRYAISTRGHNTARVNGMDQNRQRNEVVPPSALLEKAGMKTIISDKFDYASAIYDDGYSNIYRDTAHQPAVTIDGRLVDKDGIELPPVAPLYTGATHSRGVMLLKETPENVKPFFLVFDRFESKDTNDYEIIWHLDSEEVSCMDNSISTEDFTMLQSALPEQSYGNELVRGQTTPEWQGWKPLGQSFLRSGLKPIWTAKTLARGANVRIVTLLYTDSYDACPIEKIEACSCINERSVKILFKNGETLVIDEPEI